ncbi:hypothetical protein GCM10011352_42220 [Marinobacterium zhoushanense]|uniref:Uncharacterized protein n=1 Tax=Marinobacterium zhoushanense TaxID=1679163 RepID=A0ABQ1KZI3_9GAMM|nr:hypothetical protein [Marinobacterium zhoushanense]GGC11256.1 hypothetical protein GCM10011352_42220 [Marinobacterium zhoushanense]
MSGTRERGDAGLAHKAAGLSFINAIDAHLRVVARLRLATELHHSIRLQLSLFYDNQPTGSLSFDLNGFSPSEGVALARNIGANHYIMREIDEYLCGDMVE